MKLQKLWFASVLFLAGTSLNLALADDASFNGIGSGIQNLYRLSDAKTRSISPENFTGEKGRAGMATNGTGAGPRGSWGAAGRFRPRCASAPKPLLRWRRSLVRA